MTVGKKRDRVKLQLERTVDKVDGWCVVLVQPA